MLRYLVDPANAITTAGLLFSSIALYLALAGRLDLSVAAALWAVLADHLDGVVAGRTRNRSADTAKMGKSLDGFGDIIYGALLPAIILVQVNAASPLSFVIATALVLAGTIRLSYFANFGKSEDGRFLGVPLSYDIPLLAALFLARPLFEPATFLLIADVGFLALAIAHIASIRVPSPNRLMYLAITLFALSASIALAQRGCL
ncbi:hypothetical protein BJF93_09020 [Xaviernesmea oryzae]|uniref:CDP-diacylglycerol--serine O-phosphatidyltransferase n=1 Tax=Xaviernesmea oryzae TaxID=464029 RepID=A0A1Q9B3P9_9HYPH|nr:CDP-alcohol phosphatidyltransferase family protein [Xaviernesmea oryzae]OLP62680.1 hypothetical protein BJF93_09020 [Xaviernesmea oryzae]SEM36260.1 CDP-diacylglycerol---serine O-phosphatidyltransferase [Xaviernesmea oryzae]